MTNKPYKCEGDFQMGRIRQHFVIEVVAENKDKARDAVLAELGSRHGVKRREVDVQNVTEVQLDDAKEITKKRLA